MSKVRIEIDIANSAADKVLKQIDANAAKADKSLDGLGKSAKNTSNIFIEGFDKAAGTVASFAGNFLSTVLTKALSLALDGAKALFNFFLVDGVKAAQESQKVLNDFNQTLARTGIYSQKTSKDFQDYASNVELLTGVSGDLVLKNANLIQSLATLDEQGLKRATRASLDLQAALAGKGISVEQASEAVAKAADGNVTALKKMGIEIQKGRTDAETFERALSAIEKRFGGAAKQNINTYGGAVARLSETFGDLSKVFAEQIVNNPVIIKLFNSISDTIRRFSDTTRELGPTIQTVFSNVVLYIVRGVQLAAQAVDLFYRIWTTPWKALVAATLTGAEQIAWALSKVGIVTKKTADDVATYAKNARSSLVDNFTGNTWTNNFAAEIAGIGNAVETAMDSVADGSLKAVEPVNQVGRSIRKVSDEALEAQKRLKEFVENLIKQSEDIKKMDDDRLAQKQAVTEFEQQILQNSLDNQEISYYDFAMRRDELDNALYEERMTVLNDREAAELARAQAAYDQELVTAQQLAIAKQQINENYAQEKFKLDAEVAKRDQANKQSLLRLEKEYSQAKLSATSAVFGAIADIAALGGEKAFKIVKAFNLAEAITAGILSIQKAAASAPPPFNIPPIIQATALSAVNVARIVATKPSYATGGVVGGFQGASMGGDNVNANVRTGEMILNAAQQRNLFDLANTRGQGGGGETVIHTNVILDGAVVAQAVSRQVANGFQLGEVR